MKRAITSRLCLLASLFVLLLAPLATVAGAAHAQPAARVIANQTLVRYDANRSIYLLFGSQRHLVTTQDVLTRLGLQDTTPVTMTRTELLRYSPGSQFTLRQAPGGAVDALSPIAAGSAQLRLSSATVAPGGQFTVQGSGFKPHERVYLLMSASTAARLAFTSADQTVTADAGGAFTQALTAPSGVSSGIVRVYAFGESSATLEIEPIAVVQPPKVTIMPSQVDVGGTVALSITGFLANEPITIEANITPLAKVQADASGAVSVSSYTLPATLKAGVYGIRVTGVTSHRVATTTLTVQAAPVTPATVADGTVIRDASTGRVYVVWAGVRHWIESAVVLDTLGYGRSAIHAHSHNFVASLPEGTSLVPRQTHGIVEPFSPIASGSAASLSVNPPSGAPGATITLDGRGYGPNETVRVTVAQGVTSLATTTVTADAHGAFRATIAEPSGAATGSILQVYAEGTGSKTFQVEPLTVLATGQAAGITLRSSTVTVGGALQVSGSGFGKGERVQLFLDGAYLTTVSTNGNGAFTNAGVPVPSDAAIGQHALVAFGVSSKLIATATIAVTAPPAPRAAITLAPVSVHPGNKISISGANFTADEQITIQIDGATVLTVQSDAHGAFAGAVYVVPSSTRPGTYTVRAVGAVSDSATATLTVTAAPLPATVTVSPTSVHPGEAISIAGAHFAPDETVTIRINGIIVRTARAGANGAFSGVTYIVPVTANAGTYTVQASGATQRATATLTVTLSPPPPARVAGISLSVSTVHPGDRVQVSGSGFAPNDLVLIQINNVAVLSVRANASGAFANVSYVVPATTQPGTYTVKASSTLSTRSASATLVVQPVRRGNVALSDGSLIRDTATGRIYVVWQGVRHWITSTAVFNALGYSSSAVQNYPDSFVLSIPEGAGLALRQVHGLVDPLSPIASGTAVLRVTPPAAAPGASITVTGAGYAANEPVQVTFAGGVITVAANGQGTFSASIAIPANAGIGSTLQVYAYGTHSRVLEIEPISVISAVPAPTISVQPTTVTQGGTVQVSGSGFVAGEQVQLFLAGNASVITVTANGSGAFANVSLAVPNFVGAGSQSVTAYGVSSRLLATTNVTVTQPAPTPATISVKPTTANPGSLVLVSGQGFAANEQVAISFAGKAVLLVMTDGAGAFSNIGFTVPVNATAGTSAVTATGAKSNRSAVTGLTVVAFTPSLAVNPTSSTPGAQVTVTGQGFAPNEVVTLALNGEALATNPSTLITTVSGTFSATVTVPATALAGSNTLAATGATSRGTAIATLIVNLPVQTTWYLAGGSTQPGYDTQIALVNPNGQAASVTFSFMFTSGVPMPYSTTVPANSRATVDVGSVVGAGRDVFTMITANQKIGAEQTIFRSGQDFSSAIGVSAPLKTWYLAEGYTGLTFHEYIRIFNPGTTTANAELRLLPFNGRAATAVPETVGPQSGLIVDVNSIVSGQSLSAIVNSDQPVVVDRLITFGPGGYGATEQMGSNTASNTWLFAEGSTLNNFETYLTILNPSSSQQATVTATFFDQFGNVIGNDTIVVDRLHRGNIKVNNIVHSSGIATIVTSNVPVFVERPLYFGSPNGAAAGGSDVFGRNGGGVDWLFPEGNTGGSFREFLLLENPSLQTANVRVRFYQPNGQTVDYTVNVPAKSRATVDVLKDVPALTPGQHGALVTSTNGVPIIAEQSIYSDNFSKGDGTAGIAQ